MVPVSVLISGKQRWCPTPSHNSIIKYLLIPHYPGYFGGKDAILAPLAPQLRTIFIINTGTGPTFKEDLDNYPMFVWKWSILQNHAVKTRQLKNN